MTLRTISVPAACPSDRRPDAGFGVEQEVGRHHHALAGNETATHAVPAGDSLADRHLARLVMALSLVYEHERALSGLDERALWHREHGGGGVLEVHVREHLRLEQAVRVTQLDARLDRTRLGLHRGGYEVDRAPPLAAGLVGQNDP